MTFPTLRTLALCSSVLLAGPALAQAPGPLSDAEFVAKAAAGNRFEIEEAKLAEQQATDPRLKRFAATMVKDHGDALNKLAAAAGKAGMQVPGALDPAHQAMLDNLAKYKGADFDKIYQADQVAAHAETVALVSDYVQNGKNAGLKSWAKQVLPVVKGHRAMIDSM